MGQPAARLTDMHVCPMVTPGVPPIPHVGGPVTGPGCPTVLIGGMPAAVVGDLCVCVGPPDIIVLGSLGVFIGGKPAARMGDSTAHGGTIVLGCPTVLIGDTGSANPANPSSSSSTNFTQGQVQAMGTANALAQGIVNAAISGAPFVTLGEPDQVKKSPPQKIAKGNLNCNLMDEDGHPVANVNYEVTLADGSVRKGTTDHEGKISLSGIPEGNCKVSFPDLDEGEWS